MQRDVDRATVEEFRANAGHVRGPLEGTPLILLHDIGARSGRERVTPVAYTLLADGSYAVAASNGGSATHPSWYHNLVAHPRITVEVGTETFPVVARELLGAARERLWATLVAAAPTLGEFQSRTSRRIPVLVLIRAIERKRGRLLREDTHLPAPSRP
jgi:deazaflavin-dependent oxidoreductase (nitroreductase family)